jgi:hypothetical protein
MEWKYIVEKISAEDDLEELRNNLTNWAAADGKLSHLGQRRESTPKERFSSFSSSRNQNRAAANPLYYLCRAGSFLILIGYSSL